MADPVTEPIQINSSSRIAYATAGLAFNAGLVAYLVKYGNPSNGLHATAMTGALLTIAGLLGVLVSPALADLISSIRKPGT